MNDEQTKVHVTGPGVMQVGDEVWIGEAGASAPTDRDLVLAGPGARTVYSGRDHSIWRRIDGMLPMVRTPQEQAVDRVREGAIAWWNGLQR